MKTPLIVSGIALSAGIATSANAAFTGFTVQNVGSGGGLGVSVYQVYANFNAPTDILLNVLKHNVTSGTMNALHNDFGGGIWNPSLTILPDQVANDSFVTVSGLTGVNSQTNLDPSFGTGLGAAIPTNAGWFNSNPSSNIVVGSSLKIMIMQVVLVVGNAGYTASLEVGYKESPSATQPLFGSGTYTIPAPGALALLGAAGLMGRRRRA